MEFEDILPSEEHLRQCREALLEHYQKLVKEYWVEHDPELKKQAQMGAFVDRCLEEHLLPDKPQPRLGGLSIQAKVEKQLLFTFPRLRG